MTTTNTPQAMDITIAEALYTINKAAKTKRDRLITLNKIRYKIKSYLFRQDYVQLTADELKLMQDEFGIEKTDLSLDVSGITIPYDCSTIEDIISIYRSESENTCRIKSISDCIYFVEEKSFLYCLFERLRGDVLELLVDSYVDYETDEDTIRNIIDDDESIRIILEEQMFAKETLIWLRAIEERCSKLHSFLSQSKIVLQDTRAQKRLLYILKSAILIKSGLEPVAYHKDEGGQVLAYIILGRFKFHMPIDPWILKEKSISIDADRNIDLISAENKLDNPPDLEDAIAVLLSYLGLGDITSQDYLDGRYDIAEMLDIDIYEPNNQHKESDYEGYDDYENYELWLDFNEYYYDNDF